MVLYAVQLAHTYYSIDILAPRLVRWLALHGLSVQDSCLMVFTVHGICAALVLYVLPRGPRTVHIPYTVKTMRQLLHVAVTCISRLWFSPARARHPRFYCTRYTCTCSCMYDCVCVHVLYMYCCIFCFVLHLPQMWGIQRRPATSALR